MAAQDVRRTSFPTRSDWESELENSLYVSQAPPTAPRHLGSIQEPKFATESTSLFGLVFREAGPVVPSTFEVVATNVA